MKNAAAVRRLAWLTVMVAAAHGWLLHAAPVTLMPAPPMKSQPFVTRTIGILPWAQPQQLASVAAEVAEPPTRERAPAARPAAASQQRRSAPQTRPAPLPQPAAVEPAAADLATTQVAALDAATSSARRTATPSAVALLDSMRLRYRVEVRLHGIPLSGEGVLAWRHDGDSYEAQMEVISPIYSRKQRSTGRITANGLAPTRFSDKGRTEEAAHFEREKGKVVFSSNRPDAPLLPGAQDRLSVLLQLSALIAAQPQKYPAGASVEIQTAGTRDAEPWTFTIENEEMLELPGGKLRAIKLQRNARKEYDTKVELWLAPGMDYAPVRLRLTQPNGDWADQQWSSTDRS
jgi:hypothetical protein